MSYDPMIVYPKEPKLIAYGWGIVDKDGVQYPPVTNHRFQAEDEVARYNNSPNHRSLAPYRVVRLFYKEEE
jgi:hypothetical protein